MPIPNLGKTEISEITPVKMTSGINDLNSMKMKKIIYFVSAALALVACAKEQEDNFQNESENLVSLKILSSLGIDCGVLMNAGQIDDDAFVDLASYVYLSQVSHASVEPFDYIWRNLQQDSNLDLQCLL